MVLLFDSAVLHDGRKWSGRNGHPCHGLSQESGLSILLFRSRYLKLLFLCVFLFIFTSKTNLLIYLQIMIFIWQVKTLCLKTWEHCPITTEHTSAPWCQNLPWRPPGPHCMTHVHHCPAHILAWLLNHPCPPKLPAQSPLLPSLAERLTQLYS